jgi:hypothetical protein
MGDNVGCRVWTVGKGNCELIIIDCKELVDYVARRDEVGVSGR